MANEKTFVNLSTTTFLPGAEVTIIPQCEKFTEDDVSAMAIDDPWWGIVALTPTAYVALTYAAYTTGAPPGAGVVMFNADCTAFKAGNPLWWGKVIAYITAKGAKVLTS